MLRATVMVRRLKADVLPQLPSKRRQQVRYYIPFTFTLLAFRLHVRRLQKDRSTASLPLREHEAAKYSTTLVIAWGRCRD